MLNGRQNSGFSEKGKKILIYQSTMKKGDIRQITTLLNKGADINSTDKQGKTVLWWAAFNGNLQLVRILIDRKADPTIADTMGRKPLDIAADLALRGYREPGDGNNYTPIVTFLQSINTKKDTNKEVSLEAITKQMSQVGIFDTRPETGGNDGHFDQCAQNKRFDSESSQQGADNSVCILL